MLRALSSEEADVFLFLCYPSFIDTPAIQQGEMNIYSLPDLHDFDGAVIFGSGLDFPDRVDTIISRCREAGIPVIMQGTRRDGVSYVGSDNYQATKDMCAHLIDKHGVKDIYFFAGTKNSFDSELRLRALREYLRENGCESYLREVFYTNWENAAVTQHINEMCAAGVKMPDVFVCANDGLAMEACITLNKNGYDVPGDVLVTGYDYLEDSQIFDPSIASVDQCFDEMGTAAVKLWHDLYTGRAHQSEIIMCRFVPGESCGCSDYRSSDKLRRRKAREAFTNRAKNTYFNRKLDIIDSTVLACVTYRELKKELRALLEKNHDYEGDSFHILLEPNFGLSVNDPDIHLNTDGYSKSMEVIYSTEDGVSYTDELFDPRGMVPGYKPGSPNHLYVLLPLHEADQAYGYIVFRDCLDKIETRSLHTYKNRMGLVFDKFRHALALDHINKRLLDLMRRDPLTNVNNRMAYEDKEKQLQAQIDTGSSESFAIALFDVNNLKMINDSKGHEGGDEYLIRVCRLIGDVFSHSPVYRIGGDEFLAVLSGEDYEDREALIKRFNDMLSPYSDALPLPPGYISVACGISDFTPGTDTSAAEVLKRADKEMYKDKAAKKH
ncbi:MAG: GGDEF domain-containing protein [Oscillospiraceae bacterium]|nr:GGDEF domain-containing protein [Oscillospiraceae bacterium]